MDVFLKQGGKLITLIFSSYNGAQTLPQMMEALCNVNSPKYGWKIIAIDNASSDKTKEILNSYISRLPLTVISCLKRGKNNALNSALPYIEGELIIFTDDDILPDKNWLNELVDGAERNPEYSIFGGSIAPHWPFHPHSWILNHVPLGLTYGATSPDLSETEINPGLIWGANMMVRVDIFQLGYKFNENVGPNSGNYIMGSETEFNHRLNKMGYKFCFIPEAKVSHIIREEQLTRKWVLKRAFQFGKNMFIQNNKLDLEKFSTISGIPRWMISKLILKSLEGFFKGAPLKSTWSFAPTWDAWHIAGYINQALANSKKTKK